MPSFIIFRKWHSIYKWYKLCIKFQTIYSNSFLSGSFSPGCFSYDFLEVGIIDSNEYQYVKEYHLALGEHKSVQLKILSLFDASKSDKDCLK